MRPKEIPPRFVPLNTARYINPAIGLLWFPVWWLYAQYFDAFRQLSGKVSAVTIWGFADDDTWLDSFPVVRTDYPLPFDMGLQAKPAYWGIVDPTQLSGYGMTLSISSTAGETDTRVLTVTATNGNVGPAYETQINGFTVMQVAGPPSNCRPTVTAPGSYPNCARRHRDGRICQRGIQRKDPRLRSERPI